MPTACKTQSHHSKLKQKNKDAEVKNMFTKKAMKKRDRLVRRMNFVRFLDLIDGRIELVQAFKERYQHVFYAE